MVLRRDHSLMCMWGLSLRAGHPGPPEANPKETAGDCFCPLCFQ